MPKLSVGCLASLGSVVQGTCAANLLQIARAEEMLAATVRSENGEGRDISGDFLEPPCISVVLAPAPRMA